MFKKAAKQFDIIAPTANTDQNVITTDTVGIVSETPLEPFLSSPVHKSKPVEGPITLFLENYPSPRGALAIGNDALIIGPKLVKHFSALWNSLYQHPSKAQAIPNQVQGISSEDQRIEAIHIDNLSALFEPATKHFGYAMATRPLGLVTLGTPNEVLMMEITNSLNASNKTNYSSFSTTSFIRPNPSSASPNTFTTLNTPSARATNSLYQANYRSPVSASLNPNRVGLNSSPNHGHGLSSGLRDTRSSNIFQRQSKIIKKSLQSATFFTDPNKKPGILEAYTRNQSQTETELRDHLELKRKNEGDKLSETEKNLYTIFKGLSPSIADELLQNCILYSKQIEKNFKGCAPFSISEKSGQSSSFSNFKNFKESDASQKQALTRV